MRGCLLVLLAVSLPRAAAAHATTPALRGFYAALLQPLAAPAVVAALLTLALLVGQGGPAAFRRAWLPFAALLAAGLGIAFWSAPPFDPELPALAFGLVGGGLAALAWPLPPFALLCFSACVGLLSGLVGAPASGSPGATLAGLVGGFAGPAAFLAYAVGAALWVRRSSERAWLAVGLRVLGSWIAALAALMLALAVVR